MNNQRPSLPHHQANHMQLSNAILFKRKLIVEGICVLLILLFVYAASSKLMDYNKFRVELGKSPLLTAFAGYVAAGIPAIELVIAGMLSIPKFRLPGLYASLTLMVMFTAYIVAILQFSFYVPCTCGGVLQQLTWNAHLVFNIVFVALAFTAILLCEPYRAGAHFTDGQTESTFSLQ